MAATNPFRVSDLIAKYGWKVMPYLSNLGPTLLAEAQVLFVDSGHTDTLDADDTEHGHSLEKPLATWDYAVGLCTAGERSVIILAPGHNEVLANAQVDIDVSDITTIGIGEGTNKPTVDFDHANSSVDIGANNVVIRNVDFLPSITAVLIGVHVETSVTGFKMVDCNFRIGEDDAGVDEFVKAIELTSGNDDCIFENVKILAHASAAGATHGIHVAAASDRLTFKNVIIDGPFATGGIVEAAAGVNHVIEDCSIDVSGNSYGFNASSTFAKRANNNDGGVEDISDRMNILNALFANIVPGNAANTRVWYLDANITTGGDGKTPDTAFKTLTAALAACSDSYDDWILVYDYSGDTGTITINKSNVHIIGHGSKAYPWPRIKSTNDVAGITVSNGDGTVEIANIVLGGNTSYPAIWWGTGVTASKYYVHDCIFGWDSSSTAQDGIRIDSGGAAPRSRFENNKFFYSGAAGITRDGIRITGNATRSIIRNNKFYQMSGVAININSAGAVQIKVEDNDVQLESDTAGSAVTINSGCTDCLVIGNRVAFGHDGPYKEVFYDANASSTNEWSHNTGDGGLEKFRKDCEAIVAAREYKLVPGSAVDVKIWYVDANISASGDGKTPQRAFKTIDEAITACSDSHDDWVFVYDYSGGTATITLNKSWVHLVGNRAMGEYPWPRVKPSNDVAGFTLSNGKGSIEICNFKIGGNTNAPGILCGAGVVASQVWIHDCVFGWDSSTACEQALEVEATGDMPSLLFENNLIESACTENGILIAGNATKGCIKKNYIHAACNDAYPGIHVSSGGVGIRILDNRINGIDGDDGIGWGIELSASATDCFVDGNHCTSGKAAVTNAPMLDGADNSWGLNYEGVLATLPD